MSRSNRSGVPSLSVSGQIGKRRSRTSAHRGSCRSSVLGFSGSEYHCLPPNENPRTSWQSLRPSPSVSASRDRCRAALSSQSVSPSPSVSVVSVQGAAAAGGAAKSMLVRSAARLSRGLSASSTARCCGFHWLACWQLGCVSGPAGLAAAPAWVCASNRCRRTLAPCACSSGLASIAMITYSASTAYTRRERR